MRKLTAFSSLVVISSLVAACSSGAAEDVGESADAISTKPLVVAFGARGLTKDVMKFDRIAATQQATTASTFDMVRKSSKRPNGTFDLAKHEETLKSAFVDWLVAELVVESKLDTAWSKVALPAKGAHTTLDEATLLALTETHVLMRRFADQPTMHTVVPGLVAAPGCRGDILADEILPAYASAMTGLTNSALGPREGEPLRRLATQVACLGSSQLAELDLALASAADAVRVRLRARRKATVIGPYLRALAPFMLIVADAQKHRGSRSASLDWFRRNKKALGQEVKIFGWSSSARVFLYDRRSGVLEAFAACGAGRPQTCVDPTVLLETLADPRALGTGACGFAAMVSGGAKTVSSHGARYVCPTVDCAAPTTSPDNKSALDAVRGIWPEERKTSDTDLGAPGCIPGTNNGRNMQGGLPEACDGGLAAVAQNPFDEYTACMAAALPGPAAGGAVDVVQGMPLGSACGLLDGSADPAAPKVPPPTKPEQEEKKQKNDFLDAVKRVFSHAWAELSKSAAELFQHGPHVTPGPAGLGTSVILGTGGQLLSEEGAGAILGAAYAITDKELKELWADKDWADTKSMQQFFDIRAMKPAERGAAIEAIKAKNGGSLSCDDAFACTDNCTGLGAQLTKTTACSDGLVRSILTAAGRPMKGQPPTTRDLSRVSNPRPDGEVKSEGADACFIGALNPADNSSPSCGLVTCADAIASPSSTACCGGRVTAPMLARTDCLKVNCPLSTVDTTTGACGCGDVGPAGDITPIPLPPPDPEKPGL